MSTTQNTATMSTETSINYFKNIESACKSVGMNSFDDVMEVLNLMRKKDTTTIRIAHEMITFTRDENNYYGGNKYMVEIT